MRLAHAQGQRTLDAQGQRAVGGRPRSACGGCTPKVSVWGGRPRSVGRCPRSACGGRTPRVSGWERRVARIRPWAMDDFWAPLVVRQRENPVGTRVGLTERRSGKQSDRAWLSEFQQSPQLRAGLRQGRIQYVANMSGQVGRLPLRSCGPAALFGGGVPGAGIRQAPRPPPRRGKSEPACTQSWTCRGGETSRGQRETHPIDPVGSAAKSRLYMTGVARRDRSQ